MAGKSLNNIRVEPRRVSGTFDDAIDCVGMKWIWSDAIAYDFTKQPIFLDRSRIEPRLEDFDSRRREIAISAVAEGIVLGPPDQDRHGAIFKRSEVFEAKRNQFRPPAQGVVAYRDKGTVAQAKEAVGAGGKKLVAQFSRQPLRLLLSPRFGSERAAHRNQHLFIFNGIVEPQEPVDFSDAGEPPAQSRWGRFDRVMGDKRGDGFR
jgi:hypothetical protein